MTSILITGAAGTVGTGLRRRLADSEHEVTGIGIASSPFDVDNEVPVENADLRESPNLPEADTIVHLAAHSRVSPVLEQPSRAFENVAMTETVLEHARKTDASVVFASSREVYGNAIRPIETDVTFAATNPYAASKVASESLCRSYCSCYDVPVAIARFSNVYGRYDLNPRVIPTFIALADAGHALTVFGAQKVLDFVQLDDTLDALVKMVDQISVVSGDAVNIGSGVGTSLVELAALVDEAIDACPGYSVEEARTGEIDRYVANVEKARALLDWEPSRGLEQGIEQTIDWYLSHPDFLADVRDSI